MSLLIASHGAAATVAMLLGARLLLRRRKGDREHRRLGVIWTAVMYFVLVTSFGIPELDPGRYSWIHGLSVFTLGTLTVAVWAAATGRKRLHRSFVTGSYFGLLGAFVGAIAAPSREIPRLAVHSPGRLVAAFVACGLAAGVAVRLARRRPGWATTASRRREAAAASAPCHSLKGTGASR